MANRFSGKQLKEARFSKGWTQAELARNAGIRERQVLRMEKNQHVPRSDMVAAVAKATGKPVDFFFDDEASREHSEAADADDEEDDAMAALMSAIRRVVREEIRSAA